MTANSSSGPDFGRRLILHVIDDIARTEPQKECFWIPSSTEPKDGWRSISFRQYANAINITAKLILSKCGPASSGNYPTIAYIGPNDARYVVFFAAAIKAGHKALFISPRNSNEAQMNLFDKTDCGAIAFPQSHESLVRPWVQARDMKTVEMMELNACFTDGEVPHFPYSKEFKDGEWEPLVVLHTSGSTGFPKPVVVQQGMLAIADGQRGLPRWHGALPWFTYLGQSLKTNFLPMPLFHAAALYCFIVLTIYYEVPCVFGIGERPLSSDLAVECLRHSKATGCILPPSILEEMSKNEEGIKTLSRLQLAGYGGGKLSQDAGDRLVRCGVTLANLIGATEALPLPIYFNERRELWQYFIFNTRDYGCEWRKSAEEGVYELVFVRIAKSPGLQAILYTFPQLDEYQTGDLYKPHPDLPDYWAYHGRADNIIVFSNGEKLNPITIEEIVSSHPRIKSAIVVGSQRFQPALLLEPFAYPNDITETKELIDDVWSYVASANKKMAGHGQIKRSHIGIANRNKPFLRTDKGTVKKAATVQLYNHEIEALYVKADNMFESETPHIDHSSEDALAQSIQAMFETQLGIRQLDQETDFFTAGVDSLQVIEAVRLLRGALSANSIDTAVITTRVIYGNSTPRRLARHIIQNLTDEHGNNGDTRNSDELDVMKHLKDKYSQGFIVAENRRPEAFEQDQTIILTGSTGTLGSYLLHQLVNNQRVKKVICLNRADDGGLKKQAITMTDRGLSMDYIDKVEFYRCDLSQPDLGLPPRVYTQLCEETDRIIHNAWPVNFNITVETFEPYIRGVRNLANFAAKSKKRIAIAFVSSVSTVSGWNENLGPVPEETTKDMTLPHLGYGRSKMISSLILEDAAKVGDFNFVIIRVSQIAGPEAAKGVWNIHEWLPSLIASSLYLKALPYNLGTLNRVDWTPVERISKLILEVTGISQSIDPARLSGYFHGSNPRQSTFEELAPVIQQYYGKDVITELVSFSEWVLRLERTQDHEDGSMDRNPGIKLLDTYRDASRSNQRPIQLDMTRTLQRSPTMRESKAVTPELMRHWLKQWRFHE